MSNLGLFPFMKRGSGVIDLNSINASGIYLLNNNSPNSPISFYCILCVFSYDIDKVQLIFGLNEPQELYYRSYRPYDEKWLSWRKVQTI